MCAETYCLHSGGGKRSWVTVSVLALLVLVGCGRDEPAAPGVPTEGSAGRPAPVGPSAPQTEFQYQLVSTYESGLTELRGIAIDGRDRVYLAGAEGVRILDAQGNLLAGWRTSGRAHGVSVAADGKVWVGLKTRVEVYDESGNRLDAWGTEGKGPGELNWVTAIAVVGTDVFVADAGNRCIHRFDVTGDFINEIGKRDREANFIGILCPSPYLDSAVDSEGVLQVTNPGRLRVERYEADGKLLGYWGQSGMQPGRFCGCCNPTNIALFGDGRVVTAEKGIPRVTVYDGTGKMVAYLGPEHFTAEAAGLDLAIDSGERIHVADPGDGRVRVFELKE